MAFLVQETKAGYFVCTKKKLNPACVKDQERESMLQAVGEMTDENVFQWR